MCLTNGAVACANFNLAQENISKAAAQVEATHWSAKTAAVRRTSEAPMARSHAQPRRRHSVLAGSATLLAKKR